MKRKQIFLIASLAFAVLAAAAAVTWYLATTPPTPAAGPAPGERKVLYWTDPMVPGFRSEQPGKSPFMDMELVPVYADDAGGAPVVSVRPEIMQSLGVRTYQVTRSQEPRRVRASGHVVRVEQEWFVLVDIPERDAAWVRAGLPAEVRVPDLPGRNWSGRVERVEPDLDVGTRYLRAHVRIRNPERELRPNLFAEAEVTAPGGAALAVPREALIRTGTRTAVVRALGDGRFQPVDVVAGAERGDFIEILAGLNENDSVVVSGQFLIDSEANVRASFARMQPDTPAAGADHSGH